MSKQFDIVILGLTITSSWGNGHATTWRGLVRGLSRLGYKVLFLERDMPWYAGNRDDPQPQGATTILYHSFDELITRYESVIAEADLVIVGSYVPDGIHVGEWVNTVALGHTAFYDIDTPITLFMLANGQAEYISADLIPQYDAYLSFTGGPTLNKLEDTYGSPMARDLYCSVDIDVYRPQQASPLYDLGYLGTYSEDRQALLQDLLLTPARIAHALSFCVAGPQYPEQMAWPANVSRVNHLPPSQHAAFYASQRFTLNITRAAMKEAGYSPSVRLFEAAACGVPIISDWWEGLDTFFSVGSEMLVASNAEEVVQYLRDVDEPHRLRIAYHARKRILAQHTPDVRAKQIQTYLKDMNDSAPHSPRRNRRERQVAGGSANWMASQ